MKRWAEPKPLFLERMKKLLGKDFSAYLEIIKKPLINSIRCNTLKISVEELKKRLSNKGWQISQPFDEYPEIMIIMGKSVNDEGNFNNEKNINNKIGSEMNNNGKINHIKTSSGQVVSNFARENCKIHNERRCELGEKIIELAPGELGRSLEHLLGYYYIQEIASMLSVIALKPKPDELILDIAAAPGSKTTQIAAAMENRGTIIANDVNLKRLKILASNLERCGATNVVITRKDGVALCRRLKEQGFQFDKILVDAPCSGEGTIRSSPRTAEMWNPNTIRTMSKIQKALISAAIEILRPNGEMVYSTCTHAPEENEEVVDFVLKEFCNKVNIEKINLPVKCRYGIIKWLDDNYNKNVEKSCRIYPQDNNTEGFFVAKFRRIK